MISSAGWSKCFGYNLDHPSFKTTVKLKQQLGVCNSNVMWLYVFAHQVMFSIKALGRQANLLCVDVMWLCCSKHVEHKNQSFSVLYIFMCFIVLYSFDKSDQNQTSFLLGEVGDWKNHFSYAQSEQMDAAFEKHLGGTKLGTQLNYELHCKWWWHRERLWDHW